MPQSSTSLAALAALTSRSALPPDYNYGPRWDEASQAAVGPPKGLGYFGPFTMLGGGVANELSLDDPINGQFIPGGYPSLVPTLTKDEIKAVLATKEGEAFPEAVYRKAQAWALQRLAQGKSPFAQPGEQDLAIHPDLPRSALPTRRDQQAPLPTVHGLLPGSY